MPRAPVLVVVCPKTAPVGWWLASGEVPGDVGFACTAHPNDARSLQVLELVLRRGRRAVFVGDLDPLGLVQYLELARNLARRNARVRYGGLDDAWLASMRRAWNRTNGPEVVRIALDKDERRLLEKLDGAIDLERLVGPEATALLRGGHKIEIEGAANLAAYRPSHIRWALTYLRQLGARKSA